MLYKFCFSDIVQKLLEQINTVQMKPLFSMRKARSSPSKVVIVGANFGGLKAAVCLPKTFHVTVIDPEPFFEFLPNIHELVSGLKTPEMLQFPKEKAIKRSGHQFVREAVTSILPDQNTVLTSSGSRLSYNYCILSFGGQDNTAAFKGAEKHAVSFKSVRQCQAISERLTHLTNSKKNISIVIAGGGFEGVEALGEILRKYKNIKGIQIHIVEKQNRLMADAPADIDGEIRRLCKAHPVTFHTGKTITRIWKHSVYLSDESKIPSQLTILTGGVRPPKILYESSLTDAPDQWLNVRSTLQDTAHPNIFGAGDIAETPVALRKQAYHSLDMGKTAAENIIRLHAGKSPNSFKPSAKPMLVAFGDMDTFLITEKIVVAGSSLSLLKEAVFHLVMTDLDPSGVFSKAIHSSVRATESALKMLSTLPIAPSSLAKLGKIRILKSFG
jgi:NADH dehydrogenase FAD-containing subunit